jgi:hypothetical protein
MENPEELAASYFGFRPLDVKTFASSCIVELCPPVGYRIGKIACRNDRQW